MSVNQSEFAVLPWIEYEYEDLRAQPTWGVFPQLNIFRYPGSVLHNLGKQHLC